MRRRLHLTLTLLLAVTTLGAAPAPTAAAPRDTLPPVLAALRDGTVTRLLVEAGLATPRALTALGTTASALSGISLSPAVELGALYLRLPRAMSVADARTLAEQLSADPRIGSVVPDAPLYASALPDDPNYADQAWHYDGPNGVNRAAAEGRSDGTGVVVAVVDTGITAHPDLVNVLPGYDFVSNVTVANDGNGRDADASDPGDYCPPRNSSWHGTHVAGTIMAAANNGIGGLGIASGASLLPVRVLGRCGGSMADVIAGVRWAAGLAVAGVPANPTPAKVINLSIGGLSGCTSGFRAAIRDARAAGATVVVSAGNSAWNAWMSTPANCAEAITVAATGGNGDATTYTNFGVLVDVAAPGGQGGDVDSRVFSTLNSGLTGPVAPSYGAYRGTSMAAPHVAATAALLYAARPGITPDEVAAALAVAARPFEVSTRCAAIDCGAGLINIGAAIDAGATPIAVDAIDFTAPTNMVVDQSVALPATTVAGLPLQYSINQGPATCEVRDGRLYVYRRLNCHLSMWSDGNAATAAAVALAVVPVAGLPTSVSFTPIADQPLSAGRVPLYVTTSDAQSYSVAASGACRYSGGYLTLTVAGTCRFRISVLPDWRHAVSSVEGTFVVTASGATPPPTGDLPTISAPVIRSAWRNSSTGTIGLLWSNPTGNGATANSVRCTTVDGGSSVNSPNLGPTTVTYALVVPRGRAYTCVVIATAPNAYPGVSAPSAVQQMVAAPAPPVVLSSTMVDGELELLVVDPYPEGSGPAGTVRVYNTLIGIDQTFVVDQATRIATIRLSGYSGGPTVRLLSQGLAPIGISSSMSIAYALPRLGAPVVSTISAVPDPNAATLTAKISATMPNIVAGDALRLWVNETVVPIRIGTTNSDADGWVALAPRTTISTLAFSAAVSTPGASILRLETRAASGAIGESVVSFVTPTAMSAPLSVTATAATLTSLTLRWGAISTDTPYLRSWVVTITPSGGTPIVRLFGKTVRSATISIPLGTSLISLIARGVLPDSPPVSFAVVRVSRQPLVITPQ